MSNSIGRPSRGVEVVVDGSRDHPGEIILRGPNVMRGYLKRVHGQEIQYEPCAQIHTGDLGYLAENGEIMLEGRRDHLINLMGVKIHPREIEAAIESLPQVCEAYAYVVKGVSDDHEIAVDVVLHDQSADVSLIMAAAKRRLPYMFAPRRVNIVEAIRRTELGSKIVRGRT